MINNLNIYKSTDASRIEKKPLLLNEEINCSEISFIFKN